MASSASKYPLNSFKKDFPTDDTCLQFIFESLHSYECSCGGTYSRMASRKQYQCTSCRYQIAPAAGTIFHKSDTPLTLWFHALWVFSNAKSGISAKELERQLGVTYKTAWRMLKLIREALGADDHKLRGDVEMDVAFFGGRGNPRTPYDNKGMVMAAVSRRGTIKAEVIEEYSSKVHNEFLERHVEVEGTRLMTDGASTFRQASETYDHQTVSHKHHEYVRGDVHTNTLEGFWGHVKRSIKGVHKKVSKKHLQGYLNAYAFHWSNSRSDRQRFAVLLGTVLLSRAG